VVKAMATYNSNVRMKNLPKLCLHFTNFIFLPALICDEIKDPCPYFGMVSTRSASGSMVQQICGGWQPDAETTDPTSDSNLRCDLDTSTRFEFGVVGEAMATYGVKC
jgi:hypothetical protein